MQSHPAVADFAWVSDGLWIYDDEVLSNLGHAYQQNIIVKAVRFYPWRESSDSCAVGFAVFLSKSGGGQADAAAARGRRPPDLGRGRA